MPTESQSHDTKATENHSAGLSYKALEKNFRFKRKQVVKALKKGYYEKKKQVTKSLYHKIMNHDQARYLIKFHRIINHQEQFKIRKSHAKNIDVKTLKYTVSQEAGFCYFDCNELPGFAEARETLLKLHQQRIENMETVLKSLPTGKEYMADLIYDEDLLENPHIVDFALSDPILNMATEYLGEVPVLRRVAMLLSTNRSEALIRSQLFHYDGEDIRQLKFFINLMDVSEADGPFTFLPAHKTKKVIDSYLKKHKHIPASNRFPDEEIFSRCAESDVNQVTGPAGKAAAVDTSRCLHFGSRVTPGRARLILFLQYVSYHNLAECKLNTLDSARFPQNSIQRLATTPRIQHGMGHFYKRPDFNEESAIQLISDR